MITELRYASRVPVSRFVRRLAFALAAALGAACGKGARPLPGRAAETFPAAPVVLISVDTLRSDHLPSYGYAGVETPALSALRHDSIQFERAYAHAPLTLPSHASIFTGRLPADHGIHDNLGYHLKRDIPTLAELLGKAGYATGGAVSCYVLKGDSGVSRGFDFYDDEVEPAEAKLALGRVQRAGAETEKRLEAWVDAQSGKPLFAFLHLYEPHTPYEPPEPFRSRYASAPYDGEIAAADALVGTFLSFLRRKGIYDKALIVFLSDHGEGLSDHGEAEHGMFLYREALQVPLLVKLPGAKRAGMSVSAPAALSDVFTTVGLAVALADFHPPEGTASLVDLAAGAPPVSRRLLSETFFPRIHFGWSELSSLIEGRWHYIEAPRPEIFDLATDPSETNDRIAERPDALRALRAELLTRRPSFETPLEVDAEARKKLASLGYLSAGPSPAGTLEDPKDKIKTFEELRTGLGEMTGGRLEKANEIFSRLLKENPRMLDIWDMKSRALLGMGRGEEALDALEKTLELAPEAARAPYVVEVANLCLQLGKWDEGLRHAEALRVLGDPAAEDIAARAALGKGDLAAAETAAGKAMESGTGKARVRACLVLGRIAVVRNDLAAAKAFSEKAEELSLTDKLPQSGLHMLRGDVLARSGRPQEAEKEFLEELRLYPDRIDARVSLAALYASVNRRMDARRVVLELVSRLPTPESFLLGMRTFHSTEDPEGEAQLRREAKRRFPKDPRFATPASSSAAGPRSH
ncbi:MAG TPA: sulfatase-like hydrolase/transferase [Thermoanaerobaculia bacterium]|nr:sulfatase-like hydrolase/transferase [Thermoanaerobaculia bacterium]